MQTIAQLIKAGVDYTANLKGLTLFVQKCDQGDVLTVTLVDALGNRYAVQDIGAGAKLRPLAGFTSVQISTPIDANVQFIITSGDIDIQNSSIDATIANGDGAAVPVRTPAGSRLDVNIAGGTVNVTATNVGVSNSPANAVPVTTAASMTPATVAPVAVAAASAGVVVVAADASRRALRILNPASSAGPVAITPDAATTYAQAAIVLMPGDFWNETEAPGAAWFAATPAGTGATVNAMTVKA